MLKNKFVIFLALLVEAIYGQQTNGTGNGTIVPAVCNPYLQTCPAANCSQPSVAPGTTQIVVLSPNRSTFFYLDSPVNISWKYVGDSNFSPPSTIAVYTQLQGTQLWTRVTSTSSPSLMSLRWTFRNMNSGVYSLRLVSDDVDQQGITGNVPSCLNPLLPTMGATQFRLLQPVTAINTPQVSPDAPFGNFGPNTSNAFQFSNIITHPVLLFMYSISLLLNP